MLKKVVRTIEVSFFLRCIETTFALLGMNMALASLHKNVKFRIILTFIISIALCGITTALYIHFGGTTLQKIFVPIIFLSIGPLVFFNSADKLRVILFNFLTQFLFYNGISMACTMIIIYFKFESSWVYLLMRLAAFSLIIFIEVNYIRKPFQYLVKLSEFNWYIYLILVFAFSIHILSLSIYPTMYYKLNIYSQFQIVAVYIILALVLYSMYYTWSNIVQKCELMQSEQSMKEKVKYMEEYKKLSEIDQLTGLLNRSSFQKQVELNLDSAQADVLIIIDIDDFKHINDSFGHSVGDEVLKVFSSVLKASFRSIDLVGRLGGDEFMVLMVNVEHQNEIIKQKIELFNENLHKVIDENKTIPIFSVSVGIAYVCDGIDFKKFYENADIALYKAKQNGKNRIEFFE